MYVTVCDPCLNDDHSRCDEKHPDSQLVKDREHCRAIGACGGGSCVCAVCRPEIKWDWYVDIRDRLLKAEQVKVSER